MNRSDPRIAEVTLGCTLCVLLLAGCAVGPDYRRPPALGTNAIPAAFTRTAAPTAGDWKTAAPSAHLPRGCWWELFGDAELDRLERLATADNQGLAAALARFEQARALVAMARADVAPQVSAGPSLIRQRGGVNRSSVRSSTFNTFTLPLDASWELDLWGRVRRGFEGARARLAAVGDDLESARLAIQAEVAVDYFTLRALEAEARLLQESIANYQRFLQLTQNRHRSGIASELDVAQAETQLRSTEAQLPAVALQRANLRHALAALCGRPAGTFVLVPAPGAAAAVWPAVPVAVPSELLERRPDIAAAERRMAAANADVGVARAAFYPRVVLSGMAGYQAVDAETLLSWPSRLWSLGPSLQMPLFTGGRNRAQLASARAAYDASVAGYRQTVLSAFQEVEDQLASLRLLSEELDAEKAALVSARRTLEISTTRYKGGVITYLEVAIAQSAALAHEQTVVQLSARRQAAAVALIKALGAGWTAESTDPAKPAAGPAGPNAARDRNVKP